MEQNTVIIGTLEELLEYYARYSCMEKVIDSKTSEKLQKGVKDYIKNLRALNLLNIPVVGNALPDNDCLIHTN